MSSPQAVAVLGYASADYACRTHAFQGVGATTRVVERLSHPWPSLGGVYHFVAELARCGISTSAVTWIATDSLGVGYLDALTAQGAEVSGVDTTGARTPTSQLFYVEDGDPILFFDQGGCPTNLSSAQSAVLATADWVSLSVAPRDVLASLPAVISERACLQWTVKADSQALTNPVAVALSQRADIVTFSRAEREFFSDRCGSTPEVLAEQGRLVIESHGAGGVVAWHGCSRLSVPARPIATRDTTGAGDTFAAALLAGLLQAGSERVIDLDSDQVVDILERATESAASFLSNRHTRDKDNS